MDQQDLCDLWYTFLSPSTYNHLTHDTSSTLSTLQIIRLQTIAGAEEKSRPMIDKTTVHACTQWVSVAKSKSKNYPTPTTSQLTSRGSKTVKCIRSLVNH